MQITGIKALDRKLRELPPKVKKKLSGQAIRAGLRTVAKAVKQQVPPSFKRAVGSRYTTRKGGQAGVNVGKKKGRGWLPHFSLYVMGARNRTTAAGANRGDSPAHPVVDQAWQASQQAATKATIDNLKAGIIREANK